MKKLKLDLMELKVKTFETIKHQGVKGTITGFDLLGRTEECGGTYANDCTEECFLTNTNGIGCGDETTNC